MASSHSVPVDKLPQSVEEFIGLRDQIAHTPDGGAAMMVIALILYAVDEALGRQCLTIAVDRQRLEEGPDGHKGWRLRTADMRRIALQLESRPHIPRSYVKGATPRNGYQLPVPPYVFEVSGNLYSGDASSGTFKVFVTSSGASSPRPVTVRRNNRGVWKAYEWSSLIVGVAPPSQSIDDDL